MTKLDDSIFISAVNKAKKYIIHKKCIFANVYEYVVFILEIVEEYEFLKGEEKEKLAFKMLFHLDLYQYKNELNSIMIKEFIETVCKITKQTIKVNSKKRSKWICFLSS